MRPRPWAQPPSRHERSRQIATWKASRTCLIAKHYSEIEAQLNLISLGGLTPDKINRKIIALVAAGLTGWQIERVMQSFSDPHGLRYARSEVDRLYAMIAVASTGTTVAVTFLTAQKLYESNSGPQTS